MPSNPRRYGWAVLLTAILISGLILGVVVAQNPQQTLPATTSGTPLTPQALDDLVAPIALYPDPLLGQILAASTYPLEVVEAEQWVTDHPKWKGKKLLDEAKKQKWDPSVQSLVAFPDVLSRLSQDINWTTQLGNAFLAQQKDVMAAVQSMRAQAEQKGTLKSTPQLNVSSQSQNGQSAIEIQPVNPEIWYVPYYNPAFIWGPPVWGVYPPWDYPAIGVGFGFFPGIDLGFYFGGWGGWGWGGWGWGLNWFGGGIFLDGSFFHRYGFHGYGGGLGRSAWEHNPEHRLGVPYGNRAVANRYGRGGGEAGRFGGERGEAGRSGGERGEGGRVGGDRGESRPQQRFGSQGFEQRGYTNNHSVFGGYHDGGATRMQSDRGFSSIGGGRGFGGGGFGGGGFHGGGGGGRR
jgi:hypothetical protein